MKKLIIPIIALIGLCINVNAQEIAKNESTGDKSLTSSSTSTTSFDLVTKSNKELKGDKFSFRYLFDKAIDKYTHSKQLTLDGQRKLALAYHNIGMNTEAEEAYLKLISVPGGALAEDYYNYAMVLKTNGKYDEASKNMDKFIELKPDDLRAKSYTANNVKFLNMLKDDGKYKIKQLDINTEEEDFGPGYYKNQIVFSSSESKPKMIVKNYNWTGKPFWDMYVSDVKDGQLTKPKNFDKSVNGKLHDGPASFNNDGTFMAYTSNNYHDKTPDKVVELQINFSTYKDGDWSKPEPFFLNNSEYSVGHPCLTANGNTMYFTSDMPGGFGGADIYRITKDANGAWGKAENLGDKINTEGDEMFPYVEENKEILFFASDGHYGLGGLDVFICPMNGSEFGQVYNAGAPVNTQNDDFAAIVSDSLTDGYFSSNRIGGKGGDDIYAFDILRLDIGKKIIGFARDKDGAVIPKTFITLLDDKDKVIDTMTTKDDGAYAFLVDADKNFKLIGKKEKYIDGEKLTNTFGKDYIVKADIILLTKKEIIAQKIEVTADLGKILELNTVYFDLDKYNIRPDAALELAKIAEIMNEYPDMVVELRSYCDCRETKEYNQVLSDNRAKESADYIKVRISKPERISGKGYSESNLVNGCSCEGEIVSACTEAEHQKNRRTEFIIVKK